jgi:hypothetical protein
LLLGWACPTVAQDSSAVVPPTQRPDQKQKKDPNAPKKWVLNGYLKYLTSVYFLQQPTPLLLQDNLIHNRLNFSWYPNADWTVKAALRTRVFFGEFVKSQPNFGSAILRADSLKNGYTDYLSWTLLDERGGVVHSTIDRFYAQYSKGNWDIRLGRQRINWGINTIWNPNDIFNTFSFTDFDYEERPGSDALRVQYFTGVASSVEFAVKAFTNWEQATAALLWKTNKWEYDFQFLAGVFESNLVLGGGWAGAIKGLGFKGEWSYFYDWKRQSRQRHSFAGTLSFDYLFASKTYLVAGLLYNSNGSLSASSTELFGYQPSAKNVYPYQYGISLTLSQPIKERFSLGLTAIYSPGESHSLFVTPNFAYTINEQWDLSLVGQVAFNTDGGAYVSPLQVVFLRFKFSF